MVICKVVNEPAELLNLVGDELKELKILAEEASLEDLQRIVALLMKTLVELVNSNAPLLTLEMSLVRLATLAPSQDLARLISHIENLERRLATSPLPAVRPQATQKAPDAEPPPPKKPEAPVATTTDSKGWQGLVDKVKQSRPMLGSVLEHGRPLKLEPPTLEVGYPKGSFMTGQLREEDIRNDLEALATEYFGTPVKLKVTEVNAETKDAPKSLVETRQEEETDRMRRLREDAMEHPALKLVQEVFHGKIKKVIPIDKGFV